MNRDATHRHIIKTASRLFYDKGYNLTGINEIIAEAGIAKATLYSHFRSKEDLCLAYLDYRDDTLLRELAAFVEQRNAGKARVVAVLEFLLPFFENEAFNGCWCIRTVAEVERGNETIRGHIKAQKTAFRGFINGLIGDNLPDLTTKEKERLATRIYLLYEMAVAESHLHGEAWPIHDAIDLLKEILD